MSIKRNGIMTSFKKLIPAVALVAALSPFAAGAITQQATGHNASYLTQFVSQVAANSKGRPAEFNPATNRVAANSKGRPAEFVPTSNQVAANSKGRPAEFAPANRVADNAKGRPAEFAPSAPETPFG
jgi:hypothetical protein